MVALHLLWLPILLSSVFVFIVSSVIHMAPLWHKNDYPKMPNEDKVRDALRPLNILPGEYMVPRPANNKEMNSPEFNEKIKQGPVMMLSVWPNKRASMGKSLVGWFVYTLVIGIFAAYVSGRALPAGVEYLRVFRFAGTAAFLGYAGAVWQQSIWYRYPISSAFKTTVDGLIYALLTAGTFGWLWPQ
jgi:hypothetical protein